MTAWLPEEAFVFLERSHLLEDDALSSDNIRLEWRLGCLCVVCGGHGDIIFYGRFQGGGERWLIYIHPNSVHSKPLNCCIKMVKESVVEVDGGSIQARWQSGLSPVLHDDRHGCQRTHSSSREGGIFWRTMLCRPNNIRLEGRYLEV
ncbi:hypothetical protein CDAR_471221 [Caerostris darwini]|uniref:Uncharacterized protein n=1 Tax=Caerostris darwini TaxID=1538125 RepID=A0AAV4QQ91_9ARAC|nr:hypothetical protein CDAR_471221 [Caerostris darwini]